MTDLERAVRAVIPQEAVWRKALLASLDPNDPVSRENGRWLIARQYWRDRVLYALKNATTEDIFKALPRGR